MGLASSLGNGWVRFQPALSRKVGQISTGVDNGAADLVMLLETAQRQDRLKEGLHRAVNTYRLLIIGKIGYLPMGREQANLFFQVVSRV